MVKWKGLKVLKLDAYMKVGWMREDCDLMETTPVFYREGQYYYKGGCWFEVLDGSEWKAYKISGTQFLYELRLLCAPTYRHKVVQAFKVLRKEGLLSNSDLQTLHDVESVEHIREIIRSGRKAKKRLKGYIKNKMNEVELNPCPYCYSEAKYYANSESQTGAIYCTECPLGVEHSDMSYTELAKVWNNLPRKE